MEKKIKDFYDYIKDFDYGWQDVNGKIHDKIDKSYYDVFCLRNALEVKSSNRGVCWEIVEIERSFFEENSISHKIVMVLHNDVGYHCHTFSIYELNGKFYWFEGVLKDMKGIYEFDSLHDLLENVKDNFKYVKLDDNFDREKIEFYEYDKPEDKITCQMFYEHCMSSKKIEV